MKKWLVHALKFFLGDTSDEEGIRQVVKNWLYGFVGEFSRLKDDKSISYGIYLAISFGMHIAIVIPFIFCAASPLIFKSISFVGLHFGWMSEPWIPHEGLWNPSPSALEMYRNILSAYAGSLKTLKVAQPGFLSIHKPGEILIRRWIITTSVILMMATAFPMYFIVPEGLLETCAWVVTIFLLGEAGEGIGNRFFNKLPAK